MLKIDVIEYSIELFTNNKQEKIRLKCPFSQNYITFMYTERQKKRNKKKRAVTLVIINRFE